MDYQLYPAKLNGRVHLPCSKSLSHRRIFMAMLSQRPMLLKQMLNCDDTEATLMSFEALGGYYEWQGNDLYIDGTRLWQSQPELLQVKASASTLRFLIPVCLTHPGTYTFVMDQSLSSRSLLAYESLFSRQVTFAKEGRILKIEGQIQAGEYDADGSLSSQFISGLMMALPLLADDSLLRIKHQMVSREYIQMTLDVLKASGIIVNQVSENCFQIPGRQTYAFGDVMWQSDASSAAFFETAKYLGHELDIEVFNTCHQADAAIKNILKQIAVQDMQVDVRDVPDIVPALSLAMALSPHHYRIIHASRLRDKECDRLQAVARTLTKMGAKVFETEDGLEIHGVQKLHGACVTSWHDHRIAMMIAIAASVAKTPTILYDGDCVSKSWPDFFKVYAALGGKYHELPLRQ